MPMIAFAALIVVPDLPDAEAAVKKAVFKAVPRCWNRRRNTPQNHFHDCAIAILDALMEEQLGLHPAPMMALWTIWCQYPYSGGTWETVLMALRATKCDENPVVGRPEPAESRLRA
jgi:hypothetical protein